MLVEHLGVEADQLLGGEGVQIAADGIDRARDVFGGTARGALEQHVLDEMRDAVLLGVSRREPVPIQTPTETERTCGIASVITRTPLASVVISMSLTGLADRCHGNDKE